MSAPDTRVEAHYDAFPYPDPEQLVPPASAVHTAGVLSYLARRRPGEALSRRPRIWVVGCGTQQGSTWALTFPEAEVLGTDLSARTLEEARRVAAHVGAGALRLERHDLRGPPPSAAPFDLIVCTGVVHHLASPAEGLRQLSRALHPDGMMVLMVYSRAHRAPLADLRKAARRCAEGRSDRLSIALEVLREGRNATREPSLRALLSELLEAGETQPSFVADVLLHPLEHHYDVPGLHALLDEAGLRFTEWLYPASWAARRFISEPSQLAALASLDAPARAQAVVECAGLASPLLEAVVEPANAPHRPRYSREERLAMPLLLSPGSRRFSLRDGSRVELPAVSHTRDGLVGRARAAAGDETTFRVPPALTPLLQACDGHTPLATLLDRDAGHRESALRALTDLLPHSVGLLAPAWARSANPAT